MEEQINTEKRKKVIKFMSVIFGLCLVSISSKYSLLTNLMPSKKEDNNLKIYKNQNGEIYMIEKNGERFEY